MQFKLSCNHEATFQYFAEKNYLLKKDVFVLIEKVSGTCLKQGPE